MGARMAGLVGGLVGYGPIVGSYLGCGRSIEGLGSGDWIGVDLLTRPFASD